MKVRLDWQLIFALVLISLSLFFYLLDYALFHDAPHLVLYFISDLAFLFIEVLLVTLVIHRLLTIREKRAMLKKLNMVIGAFFSETGAHLIRACARFDPAYADMARALIVTNSWADKDFARMFRDVSSRAFAVDHRKGDLEGLKAFLAGKRAFHLGLLENPNLLEHDSFTNLLWAVFHLTEELVHRHDLKGLPPEDYRHLEGDITRAYKLIVAEWLMYMKHLKADYPYLFSLAVRTNPFDARASVVIH